MGTDTAFVGALPKVYDEYLVPLIFEQYATEVASRLAKRSPSRVLEIACGTGAVTRQLASALPASSTIVATDLNQAMLDKAASVGTSRPVEWQKADAMQLPFDDGSFDAVVCQFGAMFFPDKPKAFSEARRVLKPGGVYIVSLWDRIEDNEFADVVTDALATVFPADPPRFMVRIPHGYCDPAAIQRDLAAGGFASPAVIDTVTDRSKAATSRQAAIGFCQGTPIRNEIDARDASRTAEAIDVAEAALTKRFGPGPVDGKIQALIVTVER